MWILKPEKERKGCTIGIFLSVTWQQVKNEIRSTSLRDRTTLAHPPSVDSTSVKYYGSAYMTHDLRVTAAQMCASTWTRTGGASTETRGK